MMHRPSTTHTAYGTQSHGLAPSHSHLAQSHGHMGSAHPLSGSALKTHHSGHGAHAHHAHGHHAHGHHGAHAGPVENDAKFVRRQRQRLDFVAACQCLFVPWLFFCFIYAVVAFKLHYTRPWLCWLIVILGALIVLALAGLAFTVVRAKMRHDESREPTWVIFLFLTMLVALVVGAVLGNLNFHSFMQSYYDYQNLNTYNDVDPARMRGQQLMDAGQVNFVPNTKIDLRRAMGFHNMDVYCVAPITLGDTVLASYDFWAVGKNCCSEDLANFRCGEYNNPKAGQGLRLLEDENRAFYRLAVQQAEATYAIQAIHPLFFYWAEDSSAEMQSWAGEGYKYCFLAVVVHFLWQLLCVGLALAGFSKMGHF